jgi:hypothetical protein
MGILKPKKDRTVMSRSFSRVFFLFERLSNVSESLKTGAKSPHVPSHTQVTAIITWENQGKNMRLKSLDSVAE